MRDPSGPGDRPVSGSSGRGALLLLFLLPVLAGAGSVGVLPYLDGPPPGHTGGFGEPDCTACHFDAPLNPEDGALRLDGSPKRYEPGKAYALRVILEAPGAGRGGFQLSVRFESGPRRGEAAGDLSPVDGTVQVVRGEPGEGKGDPAVLYAEHTRAGTGDSVRASPGVFAWSVRWTAPSSAEGDVPVVFHAAANGANDDASEFGDRIFTLEARVPPARAPDPVAGDSQG